VSDHAACAKEPNAVLRLALIAVALVVALLVLRELMVPSGAAARVSRERAHELVARGARLVDVRTPSEYSSHHLPGALNIPLGEIGHRASELGPSHRPVVLYCRTGRRSRLAAAALRQRGYQFVYDLGSISAW
jgi:phage shock protein E